MSLVPWKGGKALLWDVTCRDTLAATYIPLTSKKAGDAARLGEDAKRMKYSVILNDCSRSRPCPCYYIFAAFM
jgi:hypothetical protein